MGYLFLAQNIGLNLKCWTLLIVHGQSKKRQIQDILPKTCWELETELSESRSALMCDLETFLSA